MRNINSIVLLIAFAQTHGGEDSMDKLADAMTGRALNVLPVEDADLDGTTLGKTGRLAAPSTAVKPVASFRPSLGPNSPVRLPTFQSPCDVARPREDSIVAYARRKDCQRRIRTDARNRARNQKWKWVVRRGKKILVKMATTEGYTHRLELISRKVESNIMKARQKGAINKGIAKRWQQKVAMIRDTRNYPEEQVAAAQPLLIEAAANRTRNKEKRIGYMKADIERKKLAAASAAAASQKA